MNVQSVCMNECMHVCMWTARCAHEMMAALRVCLYMHACTRTAYFHTRRTFTGPRKVKLFPVGEEDQDEEDEPEPVIDDDQTKARAKLARVFDNGFDAIFPSLLLWASPTQGVHIRR